jgi:hypothetical protein
MLSAAKHLCNGVGETLRLHRSLPQGDMFMDFEEALGVGVIKNKGARRVHPCPGVNRTRYSCS